eukprot:467128_1
MPIVQCITYCNDQLTDELNQLMNDLKPTNITFDATSTINDKNETGHHSKLKSTKNKSHILHKKKRGRKLPTNADYVPSNRQLKRIAPNSFSGSGTERTLYKADIRTEMNEYLDEKEPIQSINILSDREKRKSNNNKPPDDLKQSVHLYRLKIVMRKYTKYPHEPILQSVSVILGDFLYLMQHYGKDEEFEIIANELGHCDVNNCNILLRHFGRREHREDGLLYDILSKIHCYYQHCYDIGNKLSSKDKDIINKFNETKTDDGTWINKIFLKTNEILWNKRKTVQNINGISHKLSIDNIVNARTGWEHKILITVLRIIDSAFGASKYANISIPNSMDSIITQIIENQLSNEVDSVYEPCKYLTDYAKNMINVYCQNKTSLQIIISEKHLSKYKFLQKVFVPDTISIQLKSLYVMFPKIKTLHVKDEANRLDIFKTSINRHYTQFASLNVHIYTDFSKIYFETK